MLVDAEVYDSEYVADAMLNELWSRGFKIVPLEDTDFIRDTR